MFIKLVLISNFLAVALGQSVTCLNAGDNPSNYCDQFINTFCDAIDTENLRLNNTNSRCYNFDANNRCDFMAFNSYQDNTSPSSANCKKVAQEITSQCKYGGHGKINKAGPAYTFVVDYNDGPCNINI
ncbi:hypothetical protein P691DRAFT_788665 [Macrolepiota fuliginosa MF-IS2]|uniref:Glycan binding protein Y3-like domain-containing protein n=1 Tax=Macrolepiota fuliginosa MF-IS2 TaxID=1400762 RepID=A0A9P6C708_9AGAR|nr:hypothetical protein P691DRAFT_788665 [Macrolepiota fuliginosa MF-IS2]